MARTEFSFGPFRLDLAERRLLRDGENVPLPGKAFDTLVLLVQGAGTLQRQRDLMDRIWPDVSVEPNNLQYNISILRRAMSHAAGVEIETVRGQGYRFIADVRTSDDESGRTAPPRVERAGWNDGERSKSQRVQFCAAKDGARLAYALLGEGPPLVKAANWLNHLESDWNGPVWRHWLEFLSRDRRLVRYDARGNGLSGWDPPSITFEDFVLDLASVIEAGGIDRAPLLGISQGAAVAAAYAARNPGRVSALILIGGCARGWRVKGHAALSERFEALMALMRQGWGGENAAFRQIFTTSFFPEASKEQAEWFNELQRQTTSPENAVRILSALGDIDVRSELPRIHVPTIVFHSRGDAVIPMRDGIEVASGIPGSRFVPLDSTNHLLLSGEPAWDRFKGELEGFLNEVGV